MFEPFTKHNICFFTLSNKLILLFIMSCLLFTSCKGKLANFYYVSKFEKCNYINLNSSLNYRFYKPKTKDGVKYPLVIYLHPGDKKGSDNRKQLDHLVFQWVNGDFQKEHPCFVIAPQCSEGHEFVTIRPKKIPFGHYIQERSVESDEMKLIVLLLGELQQKYPIDMDRIYLAGFSMGASGCWDMMCRYPDLAAGAVIASGESDTTKAYKLSHIPIWAFSGEHDTIVPPNINHEMVDEINKHGGKSRFTLLKNIGHGMGHRAFAYPGVKEWLFSCNKKTN